MHGQEFSDPLQPMGGGMGRPPPLLGGLLPTLGEEGGFQDDPDQEKEVGWLVAWAQRLTLNPKP